MFKYRDHRGGLIESMETTQEFNNKDSLLEYLQSILDDCFSGHLDSSNVKIEPYCFDERVGWDCHIVHLEGWGVFGFTNGPVD